MPVTVRSMGVTATVKDGEWTCAEAPYMVSTFEAAPPDETHSGAVDPDYSLALGVIDAYGGVIVERRKPDLGDLVV